MAKRIVSHCARAAETVTIIGLLPMALMLFQEFGLIRMFQDKATKIQINVTSFGLATSLIVSGCLFVIYRQKRFAVYAAISGSSLLLFWMVMSAVNRSGI